MLRASIAVCLVFGLTVSSSPTPDNEIKGDRGDFKNPLSKNCEYSYSPTCLKLDLVSWVDKLNENENYSVLPGVMLVRENGTGRADTADIVQELSRSFPNDPEARLDAFLLKKVTGYFNTHSIKLNLWNQEGENGESARKGGDGGGGFGTSGFGGGGGGGGKKGGGDNGLGYLLALGAMMKGTLMSLALAALAALAGKALMVSMLALVLAALAGLKGMHGGGGKTTYEVVAKPVYSHSSSHSTGHEDYGGHHGYGRSLDLPLPMGLRADYKPPQ